MKFHEYLIVTAMTLLVALVVFMVAVMSFREGQKYCYEPQIQEVTVQDH